MMARMGEGQTAVIQAMASQAMATLAIAGRGIAAMTAKFQRPQLWRCAASSVGILVRM